MSPNSHWNNTHPTSKPLTTCTYIQTDRQNNSVSGNVISYRLQSKSLYVTAATVVARSLPKRTPKNINPNSPGWTNSDKRFFSLGFLKVLPRAVRRQGRVRGSVRKSFGEKLLHYSHGDRGAGDHHSTSHYRRLSPTTALTAIEFRYYHRLVSAGLDNNGLMWLEFCFNPSLNGSYVSH